MGTRSLSSEREERFYGQDRPPDYRTYGQRDRDRVLYSSAFRRLGHVTQVAPSSERNVFRNRLTHSLEVAQVARRLAERLIGEQPREADALGGIDPDVVEAAALAHDLGHPPFGHTTEELLDQLVRTADDFDGFEGNPQSFRIVNSLARRHRRFPGLNLSRATLNAMLKYPWTRGTNGLRRRKWGAYNSEAEQFTWARQGFSGETRSPEAEIMDWADDIAYSIHDLDDFFRVGLIPLDRLVTDEAERDRFLERSIDRWGKEDRGDLQDKGQLTATFDNVSDMIRSGYESLTNPYEGISDQRAALRSLTANFIRRYVAERAISLRSDPSNSTNLHIDPEIKREVEIIKQLTWDYVIYSPTLAAQQIGHRKIIEDLFRILSREGGASNFNVFPPGLREELEMDRSEPAQARIVADYISGMGEGEAIQLHRRLTSADLESILD